MAAEQYCLRWNNFHSNIVSNLENLKSDEDLVDVTISCEGRNIKAHKLILSACSSYFKCVFKENPCPHPIVILKGVSLEDISSLITFMYQGEVYVPQDLLASFLRTAELLQIRGLAGIAYPGSISGSETSFKSKQDKKEIPTSSVPFCVPEVSSSPTQSSPLPPTQKGPLPNASIDKQSIHVASQSLPLNTNTPVLEHREKVEEVVIDACYTVNDNGSGEDETNMWGKDDEPWNVVIPKLEPDESENVAKEEDGDGGRKLPSFDWNSIPASGSESMGQTMPTMDQGSHQPETLTSYIPAAGTHQGSNADSRTKGKKRKMAKKKVAKRPKSIGSADADEHKKPTPCPICSQVFSNGYNMKRHCDRVHLPAKVECPVCFWKFSCQQYLKKHMTCSHAGSTTIPEEPLVVNVDE